MKKGFKISFDWEVKTAADTFRANPEFKVDQAITELAVGEALISCLDEQGTPQVVERCMVMPPLLLSLALFL